MSKINEQSLLILSSKSDEFQLSNEKQILWQEMPIATIKKSSEILKPNIQIICDDNLTDINKKRIIIKLNQWLSNYINSLIPGLIKFHESNFKGSLSAIKFSMLGEPRCCK